MKSFTIKLFNFFKLDSTKGEDSNFDSDKRKLLIPLYQREYKWTKEKVQVLINDINQRDKFLGIVILDEAPKCYEIVDGQQRITTCFLALIALYNYYMGSSLEQKSLSSYIKPYGEYVLKNDSVGDYVLEDGNTLKVQIDSGNDIYFQKEAFETSYKLIFDFISSMSAEKVREFKRQLLDCELLVMINNRHGATCPVEQIFLDINEKSQLLEVEDIFKGHCFENFDIAKHDELKDKWAELKRCGMNFVHDFGFKDVSQYLYLYLLECVNKAMPENLSPNDRHYLEGKNMDETLACLDGMIAYGKNVITFRRNLDNSDYRFIDLCKNSSEYRNTEDHKFLKTMASFILDCKSAQYQKLPFMQFVSYLSSTKEFQNSFSYLEFRKSVVNLYIYAALFVYAGGRKSKKDVDHSVFTALQALSVKDVVEATKELRIEKVKAFSLSNKAKEDELRFVYSISDYYVSKDTWISQIYVANRDFTPEHFLIPDNGHKRIIWKGNGADMHIDLSKYASIKKRPINFLIINKKLNEAIRAYDIVKKIEMIRDWFAKYDLMVPNHVGVIIKTIEEMPQYQTLMELKENANSDINKISLAYNEFIDAYFDKEAETKLLSKLSECFCFAFRN